VRFLDSCRLVSAPSDPYLVEVEHLDQLVGLIGYDMNLKRPRKPESVPDVRIPELPAREFDPELRAIARKMAQNVEMRTGLGIRPNDITRVSLSKCRTFMK
jgi:hypothetical protein